MKGHFRPDNAEIPGIPMESMRQPQVHTRTDVLAPLPATSAGGGLKARTQGAQHEAVKNPVSIVQLQVVPSFKLILAMDMEEDMAG